jgi:hypothetical protein
LKKLITPASGAKPSVDNEKCIAATADSYMLSCVHGAYGPDKKSKYNIYTGATDCSAVTKTLDLVTDAKCQTGKKPADGTDFFYKASPARCFQWYAEFATNDDCQANYLEKPTIFTWIDSKAAEI